MKNLLNVPITSVTALTSERAVDVIRDYKQQGADRRYLGLCRQLFDAYPSILKSLISELRADARTLVQQLSFPHSEGP